MNEKPIGISQQTLISNDGSQLIRAKRFPQYAAGLAATLGALAAGMVLAWTSSAGDGGIHLQERYNIPISATEFSWIGSLTPLGAGVICIPIGILADIIGRKYSMLLMVIPFSVGWLLIIFANSVLMFYFGRFITGLSGGAFCVTAPMYAVEIAESEIRGSLGSYFQLLLTVGILCSYILGNYVNMFVLSIISAIAPLLFFAVFMFMPETPMYYLKKGKEDAARSSLLWLRGSNYNVEHELQSQKASLEEASNNNISFMVAIRSKAAVKGLIIAYGLMFFQQLSGVNAVIFYSGQIFKDAGSSLEPAIATIIVGVMQVVAVFISTLIVDRFGRRLLLLSSIVAMFVTTLILAIYFYLMEKNAESVTQIGWLPLVSVCIFVILFSLGFGPIPWMMMGELFAPEVKGVAASSACLFNWLMAFVVTKFYSDLENALQIKGGAFWIFSGVCALGIFFVYFVVPETKGKSLDDIQRELGN